MEYNFPKFQPVFDDAEGVLVLAPHEYLKLHIEAFERSHGRRPAMLLISDDIFCPMVETPELGWHEAGIDVCVFEGINMLCLKDLPFGTVYSPL